MSNNDIEMLTAKEVAEIMKVNVRTVHNWVRSGGLMPTWIGKREYRISRADLQDFLQKRRGSHVSNSDTRDDQD